MIILVHSAVHDADACNCPPGGSVVSIRCSRTFQPRTAQLSLFGIPLWYSSNSPRVTIQVCVMKLVPCNSLLYTVAFCCIVIELCPVWASRALKYQIHFLAEWNKSHLTEPLVVLGLVVSVGV